MQAITIYQDLLDRLSDAALHGLEEVFLTHIRLPFIWTTLGGRSEISEPDELCSCFLQFTNMLQSQGTTDYIRIAREASHLGPDRIEGVHYTHVMRNAHRIIAPYASRMVIHRNEGVWQVAEASDAIANSRWPIVTPEVTSNSETPPAPIHA